MRSEQTFRNMLDWAQKNAAVPTSQLNDSAYMDDMCGTGYQSALCGSCAPGFGRHGLNCVKCMDQASNTVIYVILCLYLAVLVALSGFMVRFLRGDVQGIAPSLACSTSSAQQCRAGSCRMTVVSCGADGFSASRAGCRVQGGLQLRRSPMPDLSCST